MKALLCALAALALPRPALAQAITAQELSAIDAAAQQTLQDTGIPSIALAVVRDGELVLVRAWGKQSERGGEPDPGHAYQIASNSKQFLAALLMILENDGKLDLDDKVVKWMPELPHADRYSVRQLLSHTAGIQDYWPQDYAFAATERAVAPMDLVRQWGMKPLDYEPGTRYQYSNTGYVIAGLIAEKAGGQPLWQQYQARIFGPLGITAFPLDATNGPAFPQGYNRFALGPVRPARPPAPGWLWAAGDIAISAADLAEWDIARIERTLLPREDWEEMESPVRLASGISNGYGLGVSKKLRGGRWVIDHGGESVGFLSQNSVWVDDRIAIVALTNGDFAGAEDMITDKVAAIVLPQAVAAQAAELPRTEDARAALEAIIAGQFPAERFTENARYYFRPDVLADFRESLGALGPLTAIEPARAPILRGGLVNRSFVLTFGTRKLRLSTYAEPGAQGRWEQFMVKQ